MPAVFLYLLKVAACSGVLMGYYRIALYNKPCHRWNRIYLLLTALASPVIPLMQWRVLPALALPYRDTPLVPLLAGGNGFVEDQPVAALSATPVYGVAEMIYLMISMLVLLWLTVAMLRVRKLIRGHIIRKMKDHWLVLTNEKGSPFSFFKFIFWNIKIDMHSKAGRKILAHELVHVREWHSLDKLVVNLLLIPFWCNPFCWLIRKELDAVHEFIADSQTLGEKQQAELSRMILLTAYPHASPIASHFYSSFIKRRLHMLNQSFSAKKNYVRLLLALPVLFTLLAAFTFTHKRSARSGASAAITVVIDASHGGKDNGAVAEDGTREKDLTLALAKTIRQLNTDPNIHIVLTRTRDEFQELRSKVDLSVKAQPDVFISLHINGANSDSRGIELYNSQDKPAYARQVDLVEKLVAEQLSMVYPSTVSRKTRSQHIWVLDAPTVNYPAVLIECGNLLNAEDRSFISDPKHQAEISAQLLKALGNFAAMK